MFRTSWTDPDAMYLAAKGGRADLNHGHMDAGSFVFEADGVRWAIDLGGVNYNAYEQRGIRLFDRPTPKTHGGITVKIAHHASLIEDVVGHHP